MKRGCEQSMDFLDDFVVGSQSDEFIPEHFEDDAWIEWEEYCASLVEIEEDGFITPIEYLD